MSPITLLILMLNTVFGAGRPSGLPREVFRDAFQALGIKGISDFSASFQGIAEAWQGMPPPQNACCPPYPNMVWYYEGQCVMSIKLRDTELYNNVYLQFYFKEGGILRIERRAIDVKSQKMVRTFDDRSGISDYGKKMLETIWKGGEFEDQRLGKEPLKRAVTQTKDSIKSSGERENEEVKKMQAVPMEEFGILDCIGHKVRYLPIADPEDLVEFELTRKQARFLKSGPKHPEVRRPHPEHPEWRLLAGGGGTNEKHPEWRLLARGEGRKERMSC